jgi:hypothetical protein
MDTLTIIFLLLVLVIGVGIFLTLKEDYQEFNDSLITIYVVYQGVYNLFGHEGPNIGYLNLDALEESELGLNHHVKVFAIDIQNAGCKNSYTVDSENQTVLFYSDNIVEMKDISAEFHKLKP